MAVMILIKELKKSSICAELGVAYGEFSDQILEIVKPELLVLVDSYPNKGNFVDEGNLKLHLFTISLIFSIDVGIS